MVDALLDLQAPSGAFLAAPDGAESTEATAWAVRALLAVRTDADDLARARSWLLETQLPEGGWAALPIRPEPDWSTALAVLALADGAAPEEREAARRGAAWLAGLEGARPGLLRRATDWLLGREPVIDVDLVLRGWPWLAGSFSWVQPTALAGLAVRAAGDLLPPRDVRRVEEDVRRFLEDRECVGGGWNFGNRMVYEDVLEPHVDATALALLALRRAHPTPATERGLMRLAAMLEERPSPLGLALGKLCLRSYGLEHAALARSAAAYWEESSVARLTRDLALSILADGNHAGIG